MPAGAVESRSEQLALVAGLLHERGTDPRIGELLDALEGSSLLQAADSPAAVNVRELRRDYERSLRLPTKLVQDLARTTAVAQRAWSSARAGSEFERFRPHLDRIVELKRAEAECVGYAREPYDALVEDYEPGITSDILGRLFDALRRELVPLATSIADASPRPQVAVLRRAVPLEGQRRFGEHVAAAVGFDFQRAASTWACTRAAPASARATAASACATTSATSRAACSPFCTRSVTGSTSRVSTRGTTALRWARRRRWGWTSRRRGSGRIGWAEPRVLGALPPARARALRRRAGGRGPRRVPLRREPGDALADPGARRRGHLQRPRDDPLRAGARAHARRPARRRPPRRVERGVPRLSRRHAGDRRGGLSSGRALGGWPHRLLPDLHPGRCLRRAALRARVGSWAISRRASHGGSSASWSAGSGSGSTARGVGIPRRA